MPEAIPAGLFIRAATPADLPTVLEHRERMFRDMGYGDPARLAAATALSAPLFSQGLRDGTYLGWLVVDGSGAVHAGGGIVLLRHHAGPHDPNERRPVVVNVFTEPEFRGRGLARGLMETMIQWSREHGFRCLYLHASTDGRLLYQSLGFIPTNEMRLDLFPDPKSA